MLDSQKKKCDWKQKKWNQKYICVRKEWHVGSIGHKNKNID